MMTCPLVLVLAVAVVYAQFTSHPAVAGALRGMGAVAAGLIAGVGIKLFASIQNHPLGRLLCALLAGLTIIAMAVLQWPLYWILPVIGGAACVLTWRRIAA
jgi:chromate transporter